MSNYITVLKLLVKSMILPDKTKSESRRKYIGMIVSLSILYLVVAAFIVFLILLLGATFLQLGLINEFITVIWGLGALIVLFFGIVGLLNYLYFSRDTEFFLSLPLRPSTIYLAKFTVVYVTELAVAALILVPALVTAGVVTGAGAFYYFISLIGILFAPSLPLMLASIIAVPLMYIVSFFKNKGALSSIALILLFALFFGIYFIFISKMNSVDGGIQNPELIVEAMRSSITGAANVLYPFLVLTRCATHTSVWGMSEPVSALVNFAIFLGIVIVLVALSVCITSFVYRRGAASQMENVKKKSTGREKFVSASALKALVKKEWRELIRTPAFAYQCLSCVVITPVLVAIFSFMGIGNPTVGDGVEGMQIAEKVSNAISWFIGFGFTLMFGVGFNLAASTSITREGRNFYFSKQMPVDYRTQIAAKKIVCYLISAISCIVSLIVLTIATKDVLNLCIGLVLTLLYSYGFTCFSIYFDLKKPKLDWAVPNEAVKQNFRIMIPYIVNIVAAIVFIAGPIFIVAVMESYAAALAVIWCVMFAAALAVTVTFHILLNKNAHALYDRLSV